MSTINTATLKSNELSEELDDTSLQAITGGFSAAGSLAGSESEASIYGVSFYTPFGIFGVSEYQASSVSGAFSGVLGIS